MTGVTIAKVPYAHRHVVCAKKLLAAAGPANDVAIKGLVENANISPRHLSEDVSAMKTSST